jgi:hypothetical protein
VYDTWRDQSDRPAGHIEPPTVVVDECLAPAINDTDGELFVKMTIKPLLTIVRAQE